MKQDKGKEGHSRLPRFGFPLVYNSEGICVWRQFFHPRFCTQVAHIATHHLYTPQ